ncbi:MAG: aminotransferase class I/II-fold pyridoxal phosphate-dependent enzyme [Stappiaceae bacterium]
MTNNDDAPRSASALPAMSPFDKVRALLSDIHPAKEPISLTVGQPGHAAPASVANILSEHIDDFGRYPSITGTSDFRSAVATWLDKRYKLGDLIDENRGILPLNGSREGLLHAALGARDALDKPTDHPIILLPNPYYQTYGAAAYVAGCEAITLDGAAENGFLPNLSDISADVLDRTVAFYLASPANPQGGVASLSYWQDLITLARRHRFFIFADECYSEIYRKAPPPGLLEAARAFDGDFTGLISFNSLSKRSNLPGLRCGFAAGDAQFLEKWANYRSLAAPQVPIPLQAVAAAVYRDEAHVVENRRLYNEKFALAEEMLVPHCDFKTPPAGFFIWLDVGKWGDGEAFSKHLWKEQGIRVVPGCYLSATNRDGSNPGTNFIRIAMVESLQTTSEALDRLVSVLGDST